MLIERGRHPRFAIGESSTPLANLLIEELAARYDLPQVRPFCKWGTWQRLRPDVACGLKRGFTFLFHQPGQEFADTDAHQRQLLVAASPHDAIADTHWYRPQFDQALAGEAQRAGAEYLDMTRLECLSHDGDSSILDGEREGRPVRVSARFVIDASGPRGFLHRALTSMRRLFAGCRRRRGFTRTSKKSSGGTDCTPATECPPYPLDDAALHHVFPGGWIWMLRFNNGITSAGAALTDAAAAAIGAADGAAGWTRLLTTPAVGRAAVPAGAGHAAVRPCSPGRVPQRPSVGSRLGDAAFGGRCHRSAVVDRISADAARYPAFARSAGTRRQATRPRSRACRLRTDDAGGARRDGTAGRSVVRDDGRSAAVQASRRCCTSQQPASAKRRAGSAVPHWRRDSCCRHIRPSAPNWPRALRWQRRGRKDRQGARSSGESMPQSSPSTPPVSSTRRAATGTRACGRPAGICREVRRDPGRSAGAPRAHRHARHTTPALISGPPAVRPYCAEPRRRRSRRERDQQPVSGFVPAN